MERLPPDKAVDEQFAKASEGLCKEINGADPTLVLGLATLLWPGSRIAKVTRVDRDKVFLAAYGESPVREELVWFLDPVLRDARDAREAVLGLRDTALAPGVDLELSIVLATLMVVLFGATYLEDWPLFDGARGVVTAAVGGNAAHSHAALLFLSRFTVAIHAAEAAHAFALARDGLKLAPKAILGWTAKTFLLGYGCLGRLRRLVNARTLRGMDTPGIVFKPYVDPEAEAKAAADAEAAAS